MVKRLFILIVAASMIASCGSDNYGGDVKMDAAQSREDMERRIKEIENNPNMPDQAKSIAIASIRNASKQSGGPQPPK